MSDKQRELARHALGLPNEQNTTFRNHYCVGPENPDYAKWEDLVEKGLAVKALGGQNWCGDFFYLTLEGAREVLLPDEHISREDAEKMRERQGKKGPAGKKPQGCVPASNDRS